MVPLVPVMMMMISESYLSAQAMMVVDFVWLYLKDWCQLEKLQLRSLHNFASCYDWRQTPIIIIIISISI